MANRLSCLVVLGFGTYLAFGFEALGCAHAVELELETVGVDHVVVEVDLVAVGVHRAVVGVDLVA